VILFPSICEFDRLQLTNPLKICPKETNTKAKGIMNGYEFKAGFASDLETYFYTHLHHDNQSTPQNL
jgi:hypothetical protein